MATYTEQPGNVFNYIRPDRPLAHCISADYALGAGIAKTVEQRYRVRDTLKSLARHTFPDCIITGEVINIVTKERYWHKPIYKNFEKALIITRNLCLAYGINHIVMPRIGSGLDRMSWERCREYIKNILVNSGISVDVYYIN